MARLADRGLPPLHHLGRIDSPPPIWREARARLEHARLLRDPVLLGDGLPRGDGRPLLLVPGFMGSDASLATMSEWLRRLGYHVEQSGLTFNVRDSETVLDALTPRVADLHDRHGRRVTLIGHSRGGLLAKVLADRHPGLVEHVVGLGSPFTDPFDLHPLTMVAVRVAQAANLVRFRRTSSVEIAFLRDLDAPARVPVTSIYSRSDGIVHWEACLRPDATCLEVDGSHTGLGVNREVYAVLARVLATHPRQRSAHG
ncbi:MAG TPA: alpha/beta hydrolase [Candidatus Dormibacteraeota bacterium]